jgi:hypothetical protein
MFDDLSAYRESLLALRLVREEILATAVLPSHAERLRSEFLADNVSAEGEKAVVIATARGRNPGFTVVGREDIEAVALAAGSASLRTHSGVAFRGRPAPPTRGLSDLVVELLDTVNSPTAVESWPVPVRAVTLHFLLRLVQPYEAPAGLVAFAAEAMVLASDGFSADRVLLAEEGIGSEPGAGKPDPDAFARARIDRMLERVGEARDRVRDAATRSLLAAWAERRESRLNRRETHLVRHLAEGDPLRRFTFQDYVDLHAGRRAPSLRSLQRDFQRLRQRGLLRRDGDAWTLEPGPLAFGGTESGA